jgi:hypothetical protein
MVKLYLLIGLLSLSAFTWAQFRGVGLFDDTVDSHTARSTGQRSASHK